MSASSLPSLPLTVAEPAIGRPAPPGAARRRPRVTAGEVVAGLVYVMCAVVMVLVLGTMLAG